MCGGKDIAELEGSNASSSGAAEDCRLRAMGHK
jgi:hypothetical protein